MSVHFIGAGPGAPDLITVRGLRLIERCPVCLYAGSLVPRAIVDGAPEGARVVDTAPLTLDEIIAEMSRAHANGLEVARVHSGDPSLYGAIAEQMRRLDALAIPYDVTPGVPAFAAAAAALRRELTVPGVAQTVILTRTAIRASAMPAGESLERLAASGATLAIHLSITNLARVVRALEPHYGADCPVAVAYRVGWPDERLIRATLADIRGLVKAAGITRTALILVGPALAGEGADSRLYAPDHHHLLRPVGVDDPDYKGQIRYDWSAAPYYELAETSLFPFWTEGHPFLRLFRMLDLATLIDLACGYGRHAAHIVRHYRFGHLTLVDFNRPNIDFCRQRFAGDSRVSFLVNSGSDLEPLAADAYSAVFCYDAMVHFEYDDVFSYLAEIARVLRPGGRALLHHSNNDKFPGARYSDNPHWRNFMSAPLFRHVAMRNGFAIVEQQVIDWGRESRLDCVTLLEKPGG